MGAGMGPAWSDSGDTQIKNHVEILRNVLWHHVTVQSTTMGATFHALSRSPSSSRVD